jgi:SAM-dependent methyltransferase
MTLHPLAAHFAGVADAYERGRPEYAPAVIGALSAELGLAPGARVLDLAAGTGKLTRALLAAGLDVVAVEPQAQLRERLAREVGAERALEGLAEAIPLADASVSAVTVADGFHWFDQAPALAEIARVLRPHGGLAVLVTIPDWSGASWAHEVGELMAHARPQHPAFDGPPWQEALHAADGWSRPREIRVRYSAPADPQRVLDYLASISWVAGLPDRERAAMFEQIAALLREGSTPPELSVRVLIALAERT